MFERFTREARAIVTRAEGEASALGSPRIEPEHLLLVMTRLDPATPVGAVLDEAGLDHERVLGALDAERERSLASVGISIGDFDLPAPRATAKPRLAAGTKTALELALRVALERGDKRIEARHLLLGVLRAERGTVPRALEAAGVDRGELVARTSTAAG